MRSMSFEESCAQYAQILDSVIDDRDGVVIRRGDGRSVVILALDDYASLKETSYLMSNPANARRLLGSIDEREHVFREERQLWSDEAAGTADEIEEWDATLADGLD